MELYKQYINDVKSGKIKASLQIKQAVERFEKYCSRDDVYFDQQCVDDCIKFVSIMHHFKGKNAGQNFILSPWQAFIVAYVFGLKYKDTGFRITNEVYIQMSRKNGKTAFIAALSLYLLLIDKEPSPEICCAANSYPQAKIIFEYIQHFSRDIDPKKNIIKRYKERLETPINDGRVEVVSSDSSRLDGKNISAFVLDEYHAAPNREVYDVLRSSQLQRQQPLAFIITTAGFNLEGPCYDMYKLSLEVLSGVKNLDNFASFIFQLDPDDAWDNPELFEKHSPNLNVTVDTKSIMQEIEKAKVDSTAKVGVLTKTCNKWVPSATEWFPIEYVAAAMEKLKLEDFTGYSGIIGMDLGSVSDFTALSLLIPKDDKLYVFNWSFIPEETLYNHPQEYYYRKFIEAGEMVITPGNVVDYDFLLAKINEISKVVNIMSIASDQWNAQSTLIDLQNLGYNVVQFSQSIGHFSGPTKSFEKHIKDKTLIINSSSMILWEFSHVALKVDHSQNVKPDKKSYKEKIDHLISMITAIGEWEKKPFVVDTEIFVF